VIPTWLILTHHFRDGLGAVLGYGYRPETAAVLSTTHNNHHSSVRGGISWLDGVDVRDPTSGNGLVLGGGGGNG